MKKEFLLFSREYLREKYEFVVESKEASGTMSPVGSIFQIDGRRNTFLLFRFSPSHSCRVTIDITVSDERRVQESPAFAISDPIAVGTYRMSRFWGLPDYWWIISDEDAWFALSGVDSSVSPKVNQKKFWKLDSYEDQHLVFLQSLEDMTTKLEEFVFPRLGIKGG